MSHGPSGPLFCSLSCALRPWSPPGATAPQLLISEMRRPHSSGGGSLATGVPALRSEVPSRPRRWWAAHMGGCVRADRLVTMPVLPRPADVGQRAVDAAVGSLPLVIACPALGFGRTRAGRRVLRVDAWLMRPARTGPLPWPWIFRESWRGHGARSLRSVHLGLLRRNRPVLQISPTSGLPS